MPEIPGGEIILPMLPLISMIIGVGTQSGQIPYGALVVGTTVDYTVRGDGETPGAGAGITAGEAGTTGDGTTGAGEALAGTTGAGVAPGPGITAGEDGTAGAGMDSIALVIPTTAITDLDVVITDTPLTTPEEDFTTGIRLLQIL